MGLLASRHFFQIVFTYIICVLANIGTAAQSSAQEFGGSGRELLFGFGDKTPGLQRDAETFGFVGTDFDAHVGIDIYAPAGTPVYSATAGEVTSPGTNTQSTANEVVIVGEAATDFNILSYEFLSGIQVKAGDRVLAGQLIGYVSSEHTELGGPHLHFGIAEARGRRLFDPTPLLLDRNGLAECVDPNRGALTPREGGYELNRVRRVKSATLNKPALLFPVGC